MGSSAHPLATQAGLDVLAERGNAFDVAVAVAAALNVVEPYMSGIGGYGTRVIYDAKKGEIRSLDAGSRMPEALDPDAFHPPTPNYLENRRSAKAASTPSIVDAWKTLSEDFGVLEWRRLLDPAIELAEGGFALDETSAGCIESEFPAFPAYAKSVYGKNGVPLKAGERLALIFEEGAEAVRGGELGQAIDSAMHEAGGFLTIDDLRENRAEWQDTVGIDHRGYQVVVVSLPVTSWNALVRLGTMDRFDLEASDHDSAEYLHAFAEVTKQAYWARKVRCRP